MTSAEEAAIVVLISTLSYAIGYIDVTNPERAKWLSGRMNAALDVLSPKERA